MKKERKRERKKEKKERKARQRQSPWLKNYLRVPRENPPHTYGEEGNGSSRRVAPYRAAEQMNQYRKVRRAGPSEQGVTSMRRKRTSLDPVVSGLELPKRNQDSGKGAIPGLGQQKSTR